MALNDLVEEYIDDLTNKRDKAKINLIKEKLTGNNEAVKAAEKWLDECHQNLLRVESEYKKVKGR